MQEFNVVSCILVSACKQLEMYELDLNLTADVSLPNCLSLSLARSILRQVWLDIYII